VAFRRLRFRKNNLQDAVLQFCLDVFNININRQSDGSHELTITEFMTIERILLFLFLKLPLGLDHQAIARDCDLDVVFFDTRQFRPDYELFFSIKNIDSETSLKIGTRRLWAARNIEALFCSFWLRCSRCLAELFTELLAQDELLDFACDRHWEFVDKVHVARNFEI
jgi:hypothetical protein